MINQLAGLLASLDRLGRDARTRIVERAIAALTPEELSRLDAELEAREAAEAERFVRGLCTALHDAPVPAAIPAPVATTVTPDVHDPISMFRGAALASRKSAEKASRKAR